MEIRLWMRTLGRTLKVSYQHLPGGTEGNHNCHKDQNQAVPNIK